MATKEDVRRLAELARVTVDDAELENFTSEFDAILAYVGQLETLEIPADAKGSKPLLRNVLRDDGTPTVARTYTERLAEQFPAREGDALLVKQIITHA